jgi:hypothetical protein
VSLVGGRGVYQMGFLLKQQHLDSQARDGLAFVEEEGASGPPRMMRLHHPFQELDLHPQIDLVESVGVKS